MTDHASGRAPRWVPLPRAALYGHCSTWTLHKRIAAGEIHAHYCAHQSVQVDLNEVDELVAQTLG